MKMKTYSVTSKTEHSHGHSINLNVLDENGAVTNEYLAIQTTDKAYADSFSIGDSITLKKAK